MQLNLRQRLLVPILLLLLLGIGAVSWIAIRNTEGIVERLDTGTSTNLLAASRSTIASWQEDRLRDMAAWTTFDALQRMVLSNSEADDVALANQLLTDLKGESRHFSGLRLAGPEGSVYCELDGIERRQPECQRSRLLPARHCRRAFLFQGACQQNDGKAHFGGRCSTDARR